LWRDQAERDVSHGYEWPGVYPGPIHLGALIGHRPDYIHNYVLVDYVCAEGAVDPCAIVRPALVVISQAGARGDTHCCIAMTRQNVQIKIFGLPRDAGVTLLRKPAADREIYSFALELSENSGVDIPFLAADKRERFRSWGEAL